ncbi:type II toxin-antitoxin system prevent-host-death family antitoxin [Opitutus sp. WL0086]|uniref:type II toxin-antitoxin system Phd/YefM family antitoxin n=1 Tax=Actomonas aquatica TaxID=2866162 RepID=UPI001C7EB89D
MNVSLADLRRRAREVAEAVECRQEVTISKRGQRIARIVPYEQPLAEKPVTVAGHPAVGMWADRADMADVAKTARRLRRVRHDS